MTASQKPSGRRQKASSPRRISRFIEPALLLLLRRQPVHGYVLMDGLKSLGFESYPVDFSAVYRTLRRLEDAGMVESDWDLDVTAGPPRRVYTITQPGEAYLASWVEDLQATAEVLHGFLNAYRSESGDGQQGREAGGADLAPSGAVD